MFMMCWGLLTWTSENLGVLSPKEKVSTGMEPYSDSVSETLPTFGWVGVRGCT